MPEDNMASNRQKLEELFKTNQMDIRLGDLFQTPVHPFPPEFDFDRVEGMMLGLSIGDALGVTSEGMLPSKRRKRYGEIRDYIPNRYVNEARGFPSDDTQLAFWTLEQMILDKGFDPDRVASRFCRERIFGIGSAVKEFIQNYKSGIPWYKAGPGSAGNGALMRIAPMVIPHLRNGGTSLWTDTALSAMITHNDSASISACLAFVRILWAVLQMGTPPDPTWWLDTYVNTAKTLEIKETYCPRGGAFTDYQGTLWGFVEGKVRKAYDQGFSVLEAAKGWYSGAYLLEAVPSVIYILMCHGQNPEEAIVRAVNDTKDNDTIAAIVGAAVGALHGRKAIPKRWVRNLSGRTTDRDDGRVFELLKQAKSLWWE
jgi:ADP-ribosyl-[dinitrogen reductase] hydrolase